MRWKKGFDGTFCKLQIVPIFVPFKIKEKSFFCFKMTIPFGSFSLILFLWWQSNWVEKCNNNCVTDVTITSRDVSRHSKSKQLLISSFDQKEGIKENDFKLLILISMTYRTQSKFIPIVVKFVLENSSLSL